MDFYRNSEGPIKDLVGIIAQNSQKASLNSKTGSAAYRPVTLNPEIPQKHTPQKQSSRGLHVYKECLRWAPMSTNSTYIGLFGALGLLAGANAAASNARAFMILDLYRATN